MEKISDKFVAALPYGHKVATRVDLLTQGDTIDLTAAGIVADGHVSVASTETRRTMELLLVDPAKLWTPYDVNDLLAPAGNELRLWRGIDFQDGSDPELVPLGTFRFTQVDAPAPAIQLQGYDRSWIIKGAHFPDTYTLVAGTNVVTAIKGIMNHVLGAAVGDIGTNFPDLDEVTNLMTFEIDADPWSAMQDLASNVGHDLFFNPLGVLTMAPVPDPATSLPVWTFDDTDEANIGLPGFQLSWDSSDAINQVIVIGENPDNQQVYRGVARDTDPTSPTQYGGPFGIRTLVIRDEKVASQFQAELRARAEMLRRLGIPQSLTIPSMVNPAFETGDALRAASTRLDGVTRVALADSFDVPFRASQSMTMLTRQRLVTT